MDTRVDVSHSVVQMKVNHIWQTSEEVNERQDWDKVPRHAFIDNVSWIHYKNSDVSENTNSTFNQV